MSDVIVPSNKVTFTLTKTPSRLADRKTIQRLMRMQRHVQNGLNRLSKRRYDENYVSPRAGRMWMTRMPVSRIVRVEKGESFTLRLTPQIMADIRAVEKYLDAKPAK